MHGSIEIAASFPGSHMYRLLTGVIAIVFDFRSNYQELLSHIYSIETAEREL